MSDALSVCPHRNCGAPLRPGIKFCGKCGRPLASFGAVSSTRSQTRPVGARPILLGALLLLSVGLTTALMIARRSGPAAVPIINPPAPENTAPLTEDPEVLAEREMQLRAEERRIEAERQQLAEERAKTARKQREVETARLEQLRQEQLRREEERVEMERRKKSELEARQRQEELEKSRQDDERKRREAAERKPVERVRILRPEPGELAAPSQPSTTPLATISSPNTPPPAGPSSGTVTWEGTIKGTELITIERGDVDKGRLTGSFPQAAFLVQPVDSKKVSIASQPGPRNNYSRLVFRVTGNGLTRVTLRWALP